MSNTSGCRELRDRDDQSRYRRICRRYYQWDNNWKLSGRFGVQSFGGAQLLNLTPFQPFTQPLVRLDIDRMDDNDNRLFGVTAQISRMPKPSYQLTVRTPLYAVRN